MITKKRFYSNTVFNENLIIGGNDKIKIFVKILI